MNCVIWLILSGLVFSSYNVFIVAKYGVPYSVSKSFYKLHNNFRFMFTIMLWGFSFSIFMSSPSVLMFMAMGCMFFVAASPQVNEKRIKLVHVIFAVSGTACGLLSIVFDDGNYWVFGGIIVGVGILALKKPKNYVFWLELVAFYGIIISKGLLLL